MRLVKGVMFKFDGNKELAHATWESWVSVLQHRQQKFDMNQELFERFKNAASVIIQYEG